VSPGLLAIAGAVVAVALPTAAAPAALSHPHTVSLWHHGAFVAFFAVFVALMVGLAVFVVRFSVQINRRRNEGAGRPRPLGPDLTRRGRTVPGGTTPSRNGGGRTTPKPS